MKRFLVAAFAVYLSAAAVTAIAAIPQDFTVQTHDRLLELSKEIENLKHREDMVPDEKKSAFRNELGSVNTDWDKAHDFALKLKTHPTKAQQKQMAQLISKVERHIDSAENTYGEKSFGLGGMLGF
jgi:lipopolysaccharide biosynthesis regulator YciM